MVGSGIGGILTALLVWIHVYTVCTCQYCKRSHVSGMCLMTGVTYGQAEQCGGI